MTKPKSKNPTVSVSIADRQEKLPVERAWLRALVRHALAAEDVRQAQISIALVDNATIHRLNNQFLQHDYPTDVITFPLGESRAKPVGEIVISVEFAIEQATEYGTTPQDEVGLYAVHGVLHLLGYDDKDEGDAEAMRERQEEILAEFVATYVPPPPFDAPEKQPAVERVQ